MGVWYTFKFGESDACGDAWTTSVSLWAICKLSLLEVCKERASISLWELCKEMGKEEVLGLDYKIWPGVTKKGTDALVQFELEVPTIEGMNWDIAWLETASGLGF